MFTIIKRNKNELQKSKKETKHESRTGGPKIGISLYAWQLIERGSTKKPHPENQKKIDRLFGTNKE